MTRHISGPITAIVPCKNEGQSIGQVIADLHAIGIERVVISVDPGDIEGTAAVAAQHGADVVLSPNAGYDGPCLAALHHLRSDGYRGYVLFLDAGNKYDMKSIDHLLDTADPAADLTFGVRDMAMAWHQKLGNRLFRGALMLRFRVRVADVSSVRLIQLSVIDELRLVDRQYSLPFQTIVNALARRMTIHYIPIRCLPDRTGLSKVSGSKANSARAAVQMAISLVRTPRAER